MPTQQSNAKWMVFLGACCIAFAPILVKLCDLPPSLIGFYRCLFAFIFLLPFTPLVRASQRGPQDSKTQKFQVLAWLSFAAFFFAADLFCWHRAVIFAGAGVGTILANTQVFYLSILGTMFFHEKLSSRTLVAIPIAFFGIFLLVYFKLDSTLHPHYWKGIAFGAATGFVYAGYILCLRQADRINHTMSPTTKICLVSLGVSGFLAMACLIEGSFALPTKRSLFWLWLLAAGPQVTGWLLISKNLPHVPVSKSGLILLAQPALATLLGFFIFRETLSPVQLTGVILTLGAIYIGSQK